MARHTRHITPPPRKDIEDPYDFLFGRNLGSPEKNLVASVLERAITDLKCDEQEARRSAHLWIFREDHPDTPDVFSFYWCMQTLDWTNSIPEFRELCREVVRLKALYGDVMLVPTSGAGSLFRVEPYVKKESSNEKTKEQISDGKSCSTERKAR